MNKNIILWIGLVLVVLVGVYMIFNAQTPAEGPAANTPSNQQTGTPSTNTATGGITTGTSVQPTGKVQIDIKGFAFVSKTVRVAPGTTITWKNFDDVAHNVVGPDFQSPTLLKGQAYSHTFTKEGTFSYFCGLHPNMSGEVIVRR